MSDRDEITTVDEPALIEEPDRIPILMEPGRPFISCVGCRTVNGCFCAWLPKERTDDPV